MIQFRCWHASIFFPYSVTCVMYKIDEFTFHKNSRNIQTYQYLCENDVIWIGKIRNGKKTWRMRFGRLICLIIFYLILICRFQSMCVNRVIDAEIISITLEFMYLQINMFVDICKLFVRVFESNLKFRWAFLKLVFSFVRFSIDSFLYTLIASNVTEKFHYFLFKCFDQKYILKNRRI